MFHVRAVLMAWSASVFVGCATPGSEGPAEVADPAGQGRHLACGVVVTPIGLEGYAAIVPSLDEDVQITLSETLPLGAGGYCAFGAGAIWGSSEESAEVTKFEVTEDDQFEDRGTLSFAGEGVTRIYAGRTLFQFVSPTKAYYVDSDAPQVIVFDPEALAVRSTIPLEPLAPAPNATIRASAVLRGDQLVITAGYYADPVNLSEVRIAVVDTVTDEVTFASTEVCGGQGATGVTLAADGTVFVSSNTWSSAAWRAGDPGAFPACAVRIPPDGRAFDDDSYVELSTITGVETTGELVAAPDGSGFLYAFDESSADVPSEPSTSNIRDAVAWELYRIDDLRADGPLVAERVVGFGPSAGWTTAHIVDGRVYFSEVAQYFQSTTLVDVTEPDEVRRALTAPGVLFAVHPLR
ncbi:MAG: hypothetical protein AAF602_28410 [Myxococcota bacterium]